MNADVIAYSDALEYAAQVAVPIPSDATRAASSRDAQILARLRKGDARAFEQLVKENHAALIRMAMGYVGTREIAEEVVQDTWMALIDALQRFEGRSSLRTWIFGILIHKAKDRGVRERRHIAFSAFESDDDRDEAIDPARFHSSGDAAGSWAFPPHPWDERTPEKLLASKQALAALSHALEQLPRGLREVLVLRDIEGVDNKEICALLQITETNLYVRLHRARERVRSAVEAALDGRNT